MPRPFNSSQDKILERLDLDAIADPGDKIRECEFLLGLASFETDRTRFRWLVSAYLNAVYSYFETTALYASVALTDPQTGDPIEDIEAIEKLRTYVRVVQNEKKPYYVKTAGLHPTIARLYEVRKAATHHFPLAIMAAGPNLPEDFHLGNIKGEGEPLLTLCREALAVIKQVQAETEA
ncbi:MAG TPA: hypothetical protein VIF10_10575 [Methylobacter sp.]|jgi:hypothetical protein